MAKMKTGARRVGMVIDPKGLRSSLTRKDAMAVISHVHHGRIVVVGRFNGGKIGYQIKVAS
jgi:hypothetical protein